MSVDTFKVCTHVALLRCALVGLLAAVGSSDRAIAQPWYDATFDQEGVEQAHQNLIDLEAQFDADTRDYARGRRKEFIKWSRAVVHEIDAYGNLLSADQRHALQTSVKIEKQQATLTPNWRPVVQSKLASALEHKPINKGLARLNRIYRSPNNDATVYGATALAGLWRSTDYGRSWHDLTTDKVPITQVWSVCESPHDPNILLLGSQHTILLSVDAGQTWEEVSDTTGRVRDIYFDPVQPTRVYAATRRGVLRSDDNGRHWKKVLEVKADAMRLHPRESGIVYVSEIVQRDVKLWVSTDGGDNFESHNLPAHKRSTLRTRLAVSAAAPDKVYLVTDNSADHGFGALYVSENRGSDWRFAAKPQDGKPYSTDTPNVLGYSPRGDQPGGQLGFCFAFAVSQDNADEMYIAGISMWKSTDGGKTWKNNASWYPTPKNVKRYLHADIHDIIAYQDDVWVVHDGGISYSPDKAKTFSDRTAGINALEILGFDINFHRPELMVNSSMHVGSMFWDPQIDDGWYSFGGADDNYCGFGIVDDNHVIHGAGYVYNRTTLKDNRRHRNVSTLPRKEPNGAIGVHTRNHQLLFQGLTKYNGTVDNNGSTLHRSTDFGETWTKVMDDDLHSDDGRGHNARHYASKSRVVGCWQDASHLYYKNGSRIYESLDDGQTWELVCDFNTSTDARLQRSRIYKSRVLDIAVDPQDDSTLYITMRNLFDSHVVMRSSDAGRTWHDFSQGIPDSAGHANSIAIQRGADGAMYVGTHRGVYYRNNTLDQWVPYHKGLPICDVVKVAIDYKNNQLRVGTFGRGIWLADLNTISQTDVRFAYSREQFNVGETLQLVDYSVLPFKPTRYEWEVTGPETLTSDKQHPEIQLTQPGEYAVQLAIYDSTGKRYTDELPNRIRVE